MAIYYKVVSKNNRSVIISPQSKYSIKYKMMQKHIPIVGKIYAFKKLVDAERFTFGCRKIFKGKGRKSKLIPTGTWIDTPWNFPKFWENKGFRTKNNCCGIPGGTILLDWFEPLETVE